jgi:GT2 family glycosyltransferase
MKKTTGLVMSKFDDIFTAFADNFIKTQDGITLVVLDDGLSDDIKFKYPGFVYTSSVKEDDGIYSVTKTINKGFDLIQPDDILFCCDDIYIHTHDIATKLSEIAYKEEVSGYVAPLTTNVWNHLQDPAKNKQSNKQYVVLGSETSNDRKWDNLVDMSAVCFFLKRSVIDVVGKWDTAYRGTGDLSDLDYSMRVREAGYRHIIAQNCLVAHGAPYFEHSLSNTRRRVSADNDYNEYNHAIFLSKWT